MKKLIYIVFVSLLSGPFAFSQSPTLELSFTGVNNTAYFQTDSIKIRNLTQGGDTVLVYPDTVFIVNYVGINKPLNDAERFLFTALLPNPVMDEAIVKLNIPGRDKVSFRITDLPGRLVWQSELMLDKGQHSFVYTPSSKGVFLLTADWRGYSSSIKILSLGSNSGNQSELEYTGSADISEVSLKKHFSGNSFYFNPGDKLMFIGYGNNIESALLDAPEVSQNYVFQFASNIPCPGLDSLLYDGKYYHTIQIFSQCWMKENLEAGTMIPGTQIQSDNGIIEKYCYSNIQGNCGTYGGLYLWDEMMQYTTAEGGQGVCPAGWHIPTDGEWKILEGAADSYYGMGHPEWDNTELRGYDVAENLKSTTGWSSNGNGTDLYGFAAKAGGYWWQCYFSDISNFGIYWTSTPCATIAPWYRGMRMDMNYMLRRQSTYGNIGYSVRCLKD